MNVHNVYSFCNEVGIKRETSLHFSFCKNVSPRILLELSTLYYYYYFLIRKQMFKEVLRSDMEFPPSFVQHFVFSKD
jgi:hypothetical protein